MLSNIRSLVRTCFAAKTKTKTINSVEVCQEALRWMVSWIFTVPSGSMSSKCFGVCACNPVSTYWPGLPCDSRTKKSPSLCSSASAAVRLIDAWNQGSVSSCERCTSAVNENGSIQCDAKNIKKKRKTSFSLRESIQMNELRGAYANAKTYAYRKHRVLLPAALCCCSHRNSCRSHSPDLVADCSGRLNCCWVVRVASVSSTVMFCVVNRYFAAFPAVICPANRCSSLFPCSDFPCLWKRIQLFASF